VGGICIQFVVVVVVGRGGQCVDAFDADVRSMMLLRSLLSLRSLFLVAIVVVVALRCCRCVDSFVTAVSVVVCEKKELYIFCYLYYLFYYCLDLLL
jgi:hypothetical protein